VITSIDPHPLHLELVDDPVDLPFESQDATTTTLRRIARTTRHTGDPVAYAPILPAEITPGKIIVFDNPARPGTMLVHRLVGFNPDGTLTTEGDANESSESLPTPVSSSAGSPGSRHGEPGRATER